MLGNMHQSFRFLKRGTANVNNYRPISLLPISSKIAEKIVSQQLLHFLSCSNSFSRTQHGCRPKLCTESALQVITDKIYNNMDNKKMSLLTVCDLSKAFGRVSHNILLRKCEQLNIDTHWLKSYLTYRYQSVKCNFQYTACKIWCPSRIYIRANLIQHICK